MCVCQGVWGREQQYNGKDAIMAVRDLSLILSTALGLHSCPCSSPLLHLWVEESIFHLKSQNLFKSTVGKKCGTE